MAYALTIRSELCTGCQMCQLACTQIKASVYGLSQALVEVARVGFDEVYQVRFRPACDSCGFCVNYCAFGAITRSRMPADAETAEALR